MVALFIDRRSLNQERNLANREKFFKRVKGQLLSSIQDLSDENISDVNKQTHTIALNQDLIEEPRFAYAIIGLWEFVLSGNSYVVGDLIEKPEEGSGKGKGGDPSDGGEGKDDFIFEVNRDEFLQLFFEDLELPNMANKVIQKTDIHTWQRQGYVSDGAPPNIDLKRSMRNSIGRRIALRRPKLEELEREEDETDLEYEEKIHRFKAVPYIDKMDLKYRHFEKLPMPSFSAVVFFMMDVSGSMGEHEKDLAKRFFMLWYYFLLRKYTNVDIIFVSHTHVAKETDEQDFFYGDDTGGTVVLPALKLINSIIQARYPVTEWNIYIGQASDGDCFPQDGKECVDYLHTQLLPIVQYMAYIQVNSTNSRSESPLMRAYRQVPEKNFATVAVTHKREIFPVFQGLFRKDQSKAKA